ncbi:tetratricopeptide repeat protein, partial [Streptomyces rubiginosohelvolus]|uniref:tetratricopeptide repeat protein n=1 Tax=Streptomyces rubiginosohelvolus TaxID=67362 RepID=UPI00362C18B5
AAAQEAVKIRRTLANSHPDAYLPDLATALNNLAAYLGEVGRHDEGLAAAQEAAEIRRTLADANPSTFGQALQKSLEMIAWLEGFDS